MNSLVIEPAFNDFAAAYEQGQPVLLVTKLVADLETPVSAYLKLSNSGSNAAFLLESVEGGPPRGR
ncbi:MAG: anthranilate synthase component I, partial [Methylocystis sp.]